MGVMLTIKTPNIFVSPRWSKYLFEGRMNNRKHDMKTSKSKYFKTKFELKRARKSKDIFSHDDFVLDAFSRFN